MQTEASTGYNLPGVLHFLQAEWRRFERERNEWAIERTELKLRIEYLEGERRGTENFKYDLMKRVKMLEYALRQERKRHLETNKETSNQDSPNTPLSPVIRDAEKPQSSTVSTTNPSSQPKHSIDHKSRERARQMLKSCLQEINYLTSMPEKLPRTNAFANATRSDIPPRSWGYGPNPSFKSDSSVSSPVTANRSSQSQKLSSTSDERNQFPSFATPSSIASNHLHAKVAAGGTVRANISPVLNTPIQLSHPKRIPPMLMNADNRSLPTDEQQPPSPPPLQDENVPVPENVDEVAMFNHAMEEAKQGSATESMQVDNFSPEELARHIQEKYNLSEDKARKMLESVNKSTMSNGSTSSKAQEVLSFEDIDPSSLDTTQPQTKFWKTKMTIKGHLDSVRAVCFHPQNMILASGSDDGTVRVHNLQQCMGRDNDSLKKGAVEEAETMITYRGHSHVITSIAISAEQNRLYSASLDSTIRAWRLPPAGHGLFPSVDPSMNIATFVGHTDAIWDIKLFPVDRTNTSLLVSASADGTAKIWDTKESGHLLKSSINYDGIMTGDTGSVSQDGKPSPTSIDFCHTDLTKMVVSYSNAKIHLIDIETGKVILTLNQSDEMYDGTIKTQINRVIAHPTMNWVVSGHEDKQIKIFDIKSGECSFTMTAHLDAVTSLDIDSSGMQLVSGGHDQSIRLWDLTMSKSCVQEFNAHRKKGDEGVLDVQYHRCLPWMVSGGADGIVKVYHRNH
ncbi:WD40-repeat-containing domain protein [Radiomyces spectabilis]|uniref:WD40-repeat-containing domain protein n=1 Tax=Radiomyces spectabilis TaxID=64574 RepID=UPI00221FB8DA|nr:WD40-repeat-containing domain protein [Radiomyces spectabilis]KAI8381394.1 WD40-repeat-containing domain protein [Radiomyces spectabilis]